MSAKARRRVEVARDVADYLDSIGEAFRAEAVRSLCRACDSYRTTLSQLHKDNMILRGRVTPMPEPELPPEVAIHYCDFCEMHVSTEDADGCKSRHCSLKARAA